MPDDHRSKTVYHLSPWRRYLGWIICGSIALLFLGEAYLVPSPRQESDGLKFAGATFFVMGGFVSLLVRTTSLEVSPEGICLQRVGGAVETKWSNLSGVLLKPGHEGLITVAPLTGKGADMLSAMRNTTYYYSRFYSEEERELLGQRRFIPIAAFAWHLRKGRRLRDDLLRYAPQLQAALEGA